jgi:hypothetical protein
MAHGRSSPNHPSPFRSGMPLLEPTTARRTHPPATDRRERDRRLASTTMAVRQSPSRLEATDSRPDRKHPELPAGADPRYISSAQELPEEASTFIFLPYRVPQEIAATAQCRRRGQPIFSRRADLYLPFPLLRPFSCAGSIGPPLRKAADLRKFPADLRFLHRLRLTHRRTGHPI